MTEEFIFATCFTCCKKPINFHKITNSDGVSQQIIHNAIRQHFWFKEDDLRTAIVCETCWEKVDQFHQFYLDVKKLHEHREVAPLSMFIKQEEIEIGEAQLQENDMHILGENQKLFDIADCKHEIKEEFDEQSKEQEPANVFPQPAKKTEIPKQSVVKRENPHFRRLLTPEERQAEDDLIKQHTRYICDECNIEFENFREIRYHRRKTHKKDTFVCCGKHHSSRARLYQHVQSFLNPEAFKCEICGNSFKTKSNYVRHKEMYHAAEEDLVFKCNRCPKSFIKEGLLRRHLAEHETLENETAKCEFCGKCFRNKSTLNEHVKVAHKKPMDFICEVCSKGFYLRAMFLAHQKTHELTAEQLKEQCPVCNKWFSSHSNLLHHMRRHKEGERKCEVCGHISSNSMALKRHMKSKHAPEREIHVCEQCGKEYARAISLKEHVANAHTREHLYQCKNCETKFFSRANMHLHRKKYHPQEMLEDRMLNNTRKEEVSVDGETFF